MNHEKILIVDEEKWYLEAILDRIQIDFGEQFYHYAFNGYEALELLKSNSYSVIILDLMLPLGGDLKLPEDEPDLLYGIYLLRIIRKIHPSIPVIIYSILDEPTIKDQIKALKATHICKLEEDSYDRLFTKLKKIIKI